MLKFSLVPKQASESRMKLNLNETINSLMFSDKFNIFKVIYVKDCPGNEWYEKIAQYVSGMLRDFPKKYELNAITQTYSSESQTYTKKEYKFQDIRGLNVVDFCFKTIPEAYECSMLGIMMIASDNPDLYFGEKQNNCCYIFARNNNVTHLKSSNLLENRKGKNNVKRITSR